MREAAEHTKRETVAEWKICLDCKVPSTVVIKGTVRPPLNYTRKLSWKGGHYECGKCGGSNLQNTR